MRPLPIRAPAFWRQADAQEYRGLLRRHGTGRRRPPEQRVSNVYKMYRVCKVGPESGIDPAEQVAFYDRGSAPTSAPRR